MATIKDLKNAAKRPAKALKNLQTQVQATTDRMDEATKAPRLAAEKLDAQLRPIRDLAKRCEAMAEHVAKRFKLDIAKAMPPPDWITAHNKMFGIGGEVTKVFKKEAERAAFVRTPQFKTIMAGIERLREDGGDERDPVAELSARAGGAISVRVPKTIHAALLAEADAEGVSLNQLCVSKLCVQLRAVV